MLTEKQPNQLHMVSGPDSMWTTANLAEAAPGVQTPLGWSVWGDLAERAVVGVSIDLGCRPRSYETTDSADERFGAIFYGRYAACVNTFRSFGDRMPGSTGDAVEISFFGEKKSGLPNTPVASRYPVVLAKLPVNAWRAPRKVARLRSENFDWWNQNVLASSPADLDTMRSMLAAASARFVEVMRAHMLVSVLAQATFDSLGDTCRSAGMEGAERDLVSGYGGMEESAVVSDLRSLAQGSMTEQLFIARHGYHGPGEGDVSSRTWRENLEPVRQLASIYRRTDADPLASAGSAIQVRESAERQLRDRVPRRRRLALRTTLTTVRSFVLGREVGKAGFLLTLDGIRATARAIGRAHAEAGCIDDTEDVFFLTLPELLGDETAGYRELIAERKALYLRYLEVDLPETWRGNPDPVPVVGRISGHKDRPAELPGTGVSTGTVRGVVKVLLDMEDPAAADFEPGDILVCRITDPAWAPVLSIAAAAVIDIGGAMSHGAIVARELGIPCVINTKVGSAVLRSGDEVEVDGAAGTVKILSDS